MNLEKIKINELKSADYNPRVISEENFEKLKQSLNQFGLVDPIVINLKNNNTIIGGHQRYRVLLEDGLDELYLLRLGDIGWVFDNIDLKVEDESIEKLMNINLNQTNLMGEWNNSKLESLFTDLELSNIDLDLTGFDDFEIDEISLSNTSTVIDTDDFDDFFEERDEPKTKEEKVESYQEETIDLDDESDNDDDSEENDDDLEEFQEIKIEDFEGKHKCPKCGYEWND